MNGGKSTIRIASVAAVIAMGFWALDAEAGHRWRRGGRHCGASHNHCYNYSGSSHGNVSYATNSYSDCHQPTEWQGGSCGSHHGYSEQSHGNYSQSVTNGGCGSHGSSAAGYHNQADHYGQSGQYGEQQHHQATQPYQTMRPEGGQGANYQGGQEMAPPPPPSEGTRDANSRNSERSDNNSAADRNEDAEKRNNNADSNRDSNKDDNSDDNRTEENRDE